MSSEITRSAWVAIVVVVLLAGGASACQGRRVAGREVKTLRGGVTEEAVPEDEPANWKTYRNEEQGYEIGYPPDLLERGQFSCEVPVSEGKVVVDDRAIRFFHTLSFEYYDAKGDHHSSLTDVSIEICAVGGGYRDLASYYRGGVENPVTIAGRKGFKIEMGAEGAGAEIYYLEKDRGIALEIGFHFHTPHFDLRLEAQEEYIPFEKQKEIFEQMLSSFRILE